MEFYNDIHLFDWLTIAENAKQIHTMETSLCYLLEKIGLTNVHVYSKYTVDSGIDNFNYIKSNYINIILSNTKYIKITSNNNKLSANHTNIKQNTKI